MIVLLVKLPTPTGGSDPGVYEARIGGLTAQLISPLEDNSGIPQVVVVFRRNNNLYLANVARGSGTIAITPAQPLNSAVASNTPVSVSRFATNLGYGGALQSG